MRLKKIISGGQTGADQGALDGAIASGFPYGGAIPAGRKTESGPLPPHYDLEELASSSYPERTARNVMNADGTLVLSHGEPAGGSALTCRVAQSLSKPLLHIDLDRCSEAAAVELICRWLAAEDIAVLNVAGPRASSDPLIYLQARNLVMELLGCRR